MRSGSRPAVRTPTPASAGRDLTRLKPLGIGLGYQAQLRDYIRSRRDRFDFLEVVPDILWTDLGRGARPRYRDIAEGRRVHRRGRAHHAGDPAQHRPVDRQRPPLRARACRADGALVRPAALPLAQRPPRLSPDRGQPAGDQSQPHHAGHLRSRDARPGQPAHPGRAAPHRRAVPDREQRRLFRVPGIDVRRARLSQRADGGDGMRAAARPAQSPYQRAQPGRRPAGLPRPPRPRPGRRDPRRRRASNSTASISTPIRALRPSRSGPCSRRSCRVARTSAAWSSSCSARGSTNWAPRASIASSAACAICGPGTAGRRSPHEAPHDPGELPARARPAGHGPRFSARASAAAPPVRAAAFRRSSAGGSWPSPRRPALRSRPG